MDVLALPLALVGLASIGAAWTALYLVLRGPREIRSAELLASPVPGEPSHGAPEFVLANAMAPAEVAGEVRTESPASSDSPALVSPRPSRPTPPPPPAKAPPRGEARDVAIAPDVRGRTRAPDASVARSRRSRRESAHEGAARRGGLEFLLGTRVLAGVGALLVLIGLGYFLDLAIERGWVSPTNRVIGGLIASTLAILAAHAPRVSRLRPWSDILAGLGFAGWYACTWFAGEVYGMISPITALLAAHLATAAAFGSGLLRDRRDLVVAALIGGFVVPLIFRDAVPTLPGLLGYHFLLAAGGMAAAVFRDHVGPRAAVTLGLVTHATLRATSVIPEDHALLTAYGWGFALLLAGGSLWSRARRGDRTRLEDHLSIALATVCVVLGPGTFGEGASLGFQYLAGAAALVAATRLTRAEGGALRVQLLAQAGVLLAVAPTAFFDTPAALGLTWCIEAAVASFLVPAAGRGRILTRVFAMALALAGAIATFPEVLPHALHATPGTHLIAALAAVALGLAARRTFRGADIAPDALLFQVLAIGLLGLGVRGLLLLRVLPEGADPTVLGILAGVSWPLAAVALAGSAPGRRGEWTLAAPFAVLAVSLAHPFFGAHPGPGTDLALLNPWSAAALFHAGAFFGLSILTRRSEGGRWIREAASFAAFLMVTDVVFEQLIRFETDGGARDLIAMLVRAAAVFVSVALVRRRGPAAIGAAGLVLGCLNLGQMLLSLAETREAAPLFFNAAFLARLVGAATLPALLLSLASGRRAGEHDWRVEARCALVVLQLVVSALLAHEIAGWAHGAPELPGLGAVSPLVGRGLLSAAWALQATGLLLWGLERGDALWRRMGLGLFVVVAGKVLLFDLAALETLARVISTASVGLLMMGASYAYAKRAQAEDDEAAARMTAGVR